MRISKPIVLLSVILAGSMGAAAITGNKPAGQPAAHAATTKSGTASKAPSSKSVAAKAAKTSKAQPKKQLAQAKPGEKKEEYPEVLDPTKFFGPASMGYAAAKACPEVVSKLFCYCGCDETDKHTSLLDCFTSIHGVDCHICQEEAIMALRLKREGVPIAEIQKRIDLQYSHEYPFTAKTETLKKYEASRLWKYSEEKSESGGSGESGKTAESAGKSAEPGGKSEPGGTAAGKTGTKGKKNTGASGSSDGRMELKAGAKRPTCCSAAEHEGKPASKNKSK